MLTTLELLKPDLSKPLQQVKIGDEESDESKGDANSDKKGGKPKPPPLKGFAHFTKVISIYMLFINSY